jgi:ferritin-like metal-binding protein YciE
MHFGYKIRLLNQGHRFCISYLIKTKNNIMKTSVLVDDEKSSAEITSLQDLFIAEIKSMYWVEKELTKAIPQMLEKATEENLKTALARHLSETKEHVKRIEDAFADMEIEPEATECEAMAALIKAGDELISNTERGDVRDAGIILAAQKVEHFEIAVYGALIVYAEILGEDNVASYFKDTLDEEFGADSKLSDVSKSVNVAADKSENGTNDKQRY